MTADPARLRDVLRGALLTAVVVGAAAGLVDGVLELSRNVFVAHDAQISLAYPLLPTTLLACLLALPAAAVARWRRWPVAEVPARCAGYLVAVFASLWGGFWWSDVAEQARQSGGDGMLFAMVLVPVLAMALGIGAAARVLTHRLDARRLQRRLPWAAGAAALVALASIVPVVIAAAVEGQLPHARRGADAVRRDDEINVLMITIDTLRADRLAAFGARPDLTPALNALAADGVVFTNAISQSPWTMPSIASLLTGRTPGGHGAGYAVNGFDLLARTPIATGTWSVAETLRGRGYVTQALVTNPFLSMRYGFDRGFDDYQNITIESESVLSFGRTLAMRLLAALRPSLLVGDIGETVSARATQWLSQHRDEKFLLWVHFLDVHAPYGDPRVLGNKSFRTEVFRPLTLAGFRAAGDDLGDQPIAMPRLRAGEIRLSPKQRQELIRRYDDGVRYDDRQVGAVLAQLQRLDLRDHTLVIVASDHGEEFWEHGGVEHGHTVYDELVRVPLIVRWPAAASGARVDDVVRLIDVAPTIVDLTGAPDTPAIEGRSLRPLLSGRGDLPRPALSEGLLFADEKRALRTGNLKYIRSASGKEELYDLVADPGEQRDLASQDSLLAPARAAMESVTAGRAAPPASAAPSLDEPAREHLRALGYRD